MGRKRKLGLIDPADLDEEWEHYKDTVHTEKLQRAMGLRWLVSQRLDYARDHLLRPSACWVHAKIEDYYGLPGDTKIYSIEPGIILYDE